MSTNEERLVDLEIRYSHQDELLTQLSAVVAQQAKEIDRLRALIEDLRSPQASQQLPFEMNEKPPHY